MVFDEIGDNNRSAARDTLERERGEGEEERLKDGCEIYLLAMDEDILPRGERLFDPCASIVKMGLEVSRGDVHDVDPCDGHVWVVDWGKPWDVDDLNEVGDAMFPEEINV